MMNCAGGCEGSSYNTPVIQDLTVMSTYSSTLLIVFCSVNILAAISSCSGNTLVFITVLSFSELHISSNIALASLAAANFLEGLSLHCFCAIGSVNVLQGGCPFSCLIRGFATFCTYTFAYSAVFNHTLVTFERYIGVIHSLRYHEILPQRHIVKLIILIWFVSLFAGLPFLVDDFLVRIRAQTVLSVTLFVALTVIFYFNFKIHCASRRQRREVREQQQAMLQFTAANQQRHRFRGAKTMFFIFVTLVICHVPVLVTRFLEPSSEGASLKASLLRPWNAVFFGLYSQLYSSISPFVYFFRCTELREYTKKLFRRAKHAIITCECYC
ncbi:adrenocorticotropic hormone receptor-like [Oculina patagonica]